MAPEPFHELLNKETRNIAEMKNVYSNVLECIGNTPLIRINRLNPNPNEIGRASCRERVSSPV
jgi:hypothetical protein